LSGGGNRNATVNAQEDKRSKMQSDDSYLLKCLITYKNRDHWDSRRDRSLLSYRQQATRELKMASFKHQLINCRQQGSKQRRARDEKDFLFQSPYERPATH